MPQRRIMVFRPEGAQLPALPFYVRSVGWRSTAKATQEYNPPRPFWQLWWGESGEGVLQGTAQGAITLRPGVVAWHAPGEAHHLHCHTAWSYRWLTLEGNGVEAFLNECGYPTTARQVEPGIPAPTRVFERLAAALSDPRGARRAFATAVEVITQAVEPPPQDEDPLVSQCLQLIEQHYPDPQFSISDLARGLRVHRSTLHRRCLQAWGMGPGARLQARRLSAVLDALGNVPDSIASIAQHCGFADPAYCARVVRRATGLPPRALRTLRGA